MNTVIRKRRRAALSWLAGLIAFFIAAILIADGLARPIARIDARTGSPLLPQGSDLAQVMLVSVYSADGAYRLVRNDTIWRMDTPEGYPVRPDRVRALLTGISDISWGEPRTRDPRKFDEISLGDPREGGRGALVRLARTEGEEILSFISGQRDGKLYGRLPDMEMAYRLDGNLPPLHGRDAWLDFAVLNLQPETIGAVVLRPADGDELMLVRDPGESPRDFRPGPAHRDERLVSPLAASTPALALSRFQPVDVKPASALTSQPVAEHITLTHDGLEIAARAYRESDGFFLTLRAVEAGEGAARAAAINARAAGWAFELTRYDWVEFTPPLSQIVERAILPPPPER